MGELQAINKIVKKVSDITVDDLQLYCEKAGVTVEALCVKLGELLNAGHGGMDKYGDAKGVFEPDFNIQYKAMVVGMELLKLIKKDVGVVVGQVTHSMAPEDISRLEMIAHELKGLEQRLVTDKVQQGEVVDV